MTHDDSLRNWMVLLVLTAIATGICIAYADRPVAALLNAHVPREDVRRWLRPFFLATLGVILVCELALLFGSGIWVMSGRKLSAKISIPLLCCWSTMWGLGAEAILKMLFGRDRPDRFFDFDIYRFKLLQGSVSIDVFPSGTAIAVSALAAVLWLTLPHLRWIGIPFAVLLCLAALLGNYHWLGDLIAGAFIGGSIGWMTVRLQSPSPS